MEIAITFYNSWNKPFLKMIPLSALYGLIISIVPETLSSKESNSLHCSFRKKRLIPDMENKARPG